ncbi:hypothetical protein, partial [Thiohalocapsa sp.]|uniref:hypothetical protein n=1 Tax=Thiohalocapsa sp. TaxID=2497641 RepID=UPI0025F6228F
MMSGLQAMAQLAELSRQQQDSLVDLDAQAEALQRQLRELLHQRAEHLKALARVHVGVMDSGRLASDLDAVERGAAQLLEQRDAAAADLTRQLARTGAAKQSPAQARAPLAPGQGAAPGSPRHARAAPRAPP